MTPQFHRTFANWSQTLVLLACVYFFAIVTPAILHDDSLLLWVWRWLEKKGLSFGQAAGLAAAFFALVLFSSVVIVRFTFSWIVPWVCPWCGSTVRGGSPGAKVYQCSGCSFRSSQSVEGANAKRTASRRGDPSEDNIRAQIERLSEQQRDTLRKLVRSGRTVEAIQEAERLLGVSLGSAPFKADELLR